MKRTATLALAIAVIGAASPAWAKKKKKDADDDDDTTVTDDDAKPAKKKPKKAPAPAADADEDKPKAKPKADDDDDDDSKSKSKSKDDPDEDFKKQDLNGHDLGTKKKTNEFEKDRFYVDKQDTAKTENATLIQGSFASTTMLYTEGGGPYTDNMGVKPPQTIGSSSANFSRLFTDLRLQTDFRHIKGGNWDARIDARLRFVEQPTPTDIPISGNGTGPTTPLRIQSGLTGQNEYEIRELWIVRNSDRSDVFIGRQFIPDLAGVKIDGVRVDYAQSNKFTLLGFGGLFPLRGSRSLTTDYLPDFFVDSNGTKQPVGRFTGAGGFGAAYRTLNAYGSFGGVVEAPLGGGEEPRVFGTSTGYWRYGTQLDLYHFAVIDLVGTQADASHFTNISVGANYKPSPRLRLTASYNRVDNETLSVQAGAFLNSADNTLGIVQNETYLQRLSTNELRGAASAGLGPLQRFELTGALTFKYRPDVTLQEINTNATPTVTNLTLHAEEGVEAYASLTDRHSIKDARLALDVLRTFAVGSIAYQHTDIFAIRASAAHDFHAGQGEWEAEIAYSKTSDSAIGQACDTTNLDTCFGSAVTSLVSVGGSAYYRINRDWMGLASMYLTSMNLSRSSGTVIVDPAVTGFTGFLRLAYRF